MLLDTTRVARRILAQIARDPRFVGLACAVPVLLVLLLKAVFEGVPMFQRLGLRIGVYALPAGGFIVFFLAYVLSTIVLVRERRDGTLERTLAAGYGRASVVLGYVLGYGTIAAVQTAFLFGTTLLAFDVPLAGRVAPVVATTLSLAVVSVALGVFVSALARTEGQVFPTIPLVIAPSLLLCGLVIPLASLPGWLRAIAYAIPLTHAEKVLLGLLRDGRTFAEVAPWLGALVAMGAGLLAAASLTVRARA
ncbi:MAG: ABC transporter permease [Planctomycetales bacterium]|nr:ABC transporter permease [Planctomycetales bacterium]